MKDRKGNPILIVMAVWICVLGTMLLWLVTDTRRVEKALALTTSKAFYQQVVLSRRWNASHGGVYVPITASTPPNEYLPLENRDLTAGGLKLTRINPAYMTRQMAELAQTDAGGIQFHITSLKPIRPENRPTEWEERWLSSFEQGVKEQGEFFDDGKTTWFRYMAPLITGPECLKCHAQQGYKEGDIRGGLSISLPYPTNTHVGLFVGYSAVATISLFIIFICSTLYERKRLLFDATFNSPLPACITDTNHEILMANDSYWSMFGPLPAGRKSLKCYEHRPGNACRTERCPLNQAMGGATTYTYETSKNKDGVFLPFIVTAKPLLDVTGRVVGIVESFQEISELKRTERALEESNHKLETLSITDALTRIANRRRFDEVLVQEHARHARSGAELSLILLDIDQFKAFNDRYGHVNGDECLQRIARVIADCACRPADLAARYGGEEFACILPETGRGGAVAVAEKIRRGIINLAIPHHGSKVADYVTASLGVVTVKCSDEESVVDIVARVDELLYQAKASGRNRVEFVPAHVVVKGEIKDNPVQLVWEDSFRCGHLLIDLQHQSLFRLSKELLDAVITDRPAPEVSALIARLLDEVSQHFHDEEKFLVSVQFPGLSEHLAKHAELLANGIELSEQFKASTLKVADVFQFLASEVIMRHILEADHEYFPYIGKTGEG